MAKITRMPANGGEGQTPTQQAMAMGAHPTTVIQDELGRNFTLRKLSSMELMQLSRKMGADNASNSIWFTMAICTATVRAIDDTPYPFTPGSPAEAEKKMDIIGEAGMALLQKWIEDTADQKAVTTVDDAKN